MATYKITSTGNTIVAEQDFMDSVHPNDYTLLEEPSPVVEVKTWDAFSFYRKFTSAERINLRALAATDPIVDDFIKTLDAAIASGTRVFADDQDMINGLAYFTTQPPSSPVLTTARAAEIVA